jgi:hypothetical protein
MFIVIYDGDLGNPIDYYPKSWVENNPKEWFEVIKQCDNIDDLMIMEQTHPMFFNPVSIAGGEKVTKCLGVYFTNGGEQYGIFGDHLKSRYWLIDYVEGLRVMGSARSWMDITHQLREILDYQKTTKKVRVR